MKFLLLATLILWAFSGDARAQGWPQLEVPRSAKPPRLEADPDEKTWDAAATIPSLTVSRGPDGIGLTPRSTVVAVLWDAHYLYLRFRCADEDIYTPVTGRDAELYKGDVAEVFLDPVGDARWYAELQVSPHGDIFDQMFALTAEPRTNPNGRLADEVLARDWWPNPSWTLDGLRVASRILEKRGQVSGWIVDMAIPAAPLLKRLGKTQFEPMALRANIMRYDWLPGDLPAGARRLLAMNWAPVDYGCPHISPQAMGFLILKP